VAGSGEILADENGVVSVVIELAVSFVSKGYRNGSARVFKAIIAGGETALFG
jgi:hypothetical protein